jgi:hypothetical protein
VPGLTEVPYLTSDTVMRLDALPRSMAVIGGGFIAAEMSRIFGSLGTAVTIIERGEHLLSRHDNGIQARFAEHYRERFDLRLNSAVQRVLPSGTRVAPLGGESGLGGPAHVGRPGVLACRAGSYLAWHRPGRRHTRRARLGLLNVPAAFALSALALWAGLHVFGA